MKHPSATSEILQHFFTFPRFCTDDSLYTEHLPRRNSPLSESDLYSEVQCGPIYGLALYERISFARVLVLCAMLLLLSRLAFDVFSSNFLLVVPWAYSIVFGYYSFNLPGRSESLPKDQPVSVGSIRFRFSCVRQIRPHRYFRSLTWLRGLENNFLAMFVRQKPT
jgi:hypothetical protein